MENISENYQQELELAKNLIRTDKKLTSLQKELLITTIGCEKYKSYSIEEFEESSHIYNELGSLLDKEFYKIGKKTYSYFSWWFFRTTFEKEMSLTSNLVLANWFSIMEDSQELLSISETQEHLKETYILHKNFLNINNKTDELLNYNKNENLNVITSIWLDKEQIIEAIDNFFELIKENKYLKTSFRNIIYHENGQWIKETMIKKHKWKKKYKEYLDLNDSQTNKNNAIANNN